MARIKIIELIDRPDLGGGQAAVLLLARGLDPQRFEAVVSSADGGPLVAATVKSGLRHVPFRPGPRFSRRTAAAISGLLRDEGADILHTHGGYAGLYGRWAARRAKTPVVVHTLHGIHYLHYRNPLLRRLSIWQERFLCRTTDALILVCRSDLGLAGKHRLAPAGRLVVIPNGFDGVPAGAPAPAADLRRELGLEPNGPVIGTVARLHRQKGVAHLLRAAPRILGEVPGSRIIVVGEGPQGAKLRREADGRGLGGRLVFLGERADALSIMSLFDVFVLPSLWEGLPFVLVEAAALGKPIVATAVDGVPEVIEDGRTGVLVHPGDEEALAEAVIGLLADRQKASRLAEAARTLIPPRFPLRRTIEQHEDLYLRLYRRKTGIDLAR